MNPKDVLEIAASELDRLSEDLICRRLTLPQPLAAIESLHGRLAALQQDLPSLEPTELPAMLQSVLTKAKRVQTLLEAGTIFHCHSIFGRPEAPGTYGSDGMFNTTHGSRIIFQG